MTKPAKATTYRSGKSWIPNGPIRFKCSLNNVILEVMRCRGWQEVTSDDEEWDFFWCDREWLKENYKMYLPEHVRICHFRNHYELTRKNLMVKNIKRLRKRIEKESGKQDTTKMDFIPKTFDLPCEYHMFLEEFKKSPGSIWIMKPIARSQGKGIFLFRRLKDIEAWKKTQYQGQSDPNYESPEAYVVSRYIENPYLICGRKFDLRIYVLVTSYNPLKVWLYRDGFARFSLARFSLNKLEDQYIHLTNVAIQKTAPEFDPENGLKWSIVKLRRYMIAKHGIEKVEAMFRQMDNIFIQSLLSVQKIMINDKNCFELYGYDILLDSRLRPWLLEINAAPSLTASSKEDFDLKFGLLEDTLHIVDMENRLTGRERRIGGFDLIWDEGPVATAETYRQPDGLYSSNYSFNSFLGCQNDREDHLKKLFRELTLKAADNETT